jgi:hypothetical protein
MAKVPMRVIPEPVEGTREIFSSRTAGSKVITGNQGATTLVCGNCRAILAKSVGRDEPIVFEAEPPWTPLLTVRDLVFKCKGCGAFNEAR